MESVQWNFDAKVYEIDSFFYVLFMRKYRNIIGNQGRSLMQINKTSYEDWTFRDMNSIINCLES